MSLEPVPNIFKLLERLGQTPGQVAYRGAGSWESRQLDFSDVLGEVSDAQIPDGISRDAEVAAAIAAAIALLNFEDGADVTDAENVAAAIHAQMAKLSLADADTFAIIDSENSNALSKITWMVLRIALNDIYARYAEVQQWEQQQHYTATQLVDAASVAWNANTPVVYLVMDTVGATRDIANPTNVQPLADYRMQIEQDGTGGRVVGTWGSMFKWVGGTPPTLPADPNARAIITFLADRTGTELWGISQDLA